MPAKRAGGRIRNRNWRWIVISGVLVLAVLLLFVFRWRREGFDGAAFAAAFLKLRWDWLLWAALLSVAGYYVRALRWAILIRPVCPNPSRWRLFSATAIGFTAVVIFGRPGELVRPYLIAWRENVPFSSQVAAWLLERIYDLLAALLIFGFALAHIEQSGMQVGQRLEWVLKAGGYFVAVIGLVCVAILFMLQTCADAMRRRLLAALGFLPGRYQRKADELVTAFTQGAQATKTGSAMAGMSAYTVLEWGIIAACYLCLFRAFPPLAGLHLTDVLILIGFVSFGSIVQIPGVGGGMQIVSVVVLTELFKLSLELASSVAIMIWVVAFVVIVPVGLVLLFHEGLNWQRLKQMEAEASL